MQSQHENSPAVNAVAGPDAFPEASIRPQDTAVGRALDAMAMRYVVVSSGVTLLLQAGLTMEVLEDVERHFIPHAPTWCDGVVNLRGELLPIVVPGRLLEKAPTAEAAPSRRYLLVLRPESSAPVAIPLDQLPDKTRFSELSPTALPGGLPAAITAAYRLGERTLLELDHAALLESLRPEPDTLPASGRQTVETGES